MPSIIVKNTDTKNLQWRNVIFPASKGIPIDAVLFNKLRHEFVPIYGSCGLVWDESKLQASLKKFKSDCFAEFESLGIPAVKASVAAGALSKGDKHELALEWLATEIMPVHNSTANPSPNASDNPNKSVFISPIKIAEGVIASLVFACIVYLVYTHFDLKLN